MSAVEKGEGDFLSRQAHAIRHRGDRLRRSGEFEASRAAYVEALRMYRRCLEAPPLDLANALRGFALSCEAMGDRAEARERWLEARTLYEQVGVAAGVEESDTRLRGLDNSATVQIERH